MEKNFTLPDYIFEISWELCNRTGGINTVIITKSITLTKEYKDNLILIGPDIWRETEVNPDFTEDTNLFKGWRDKALADGLRLRIGRYNIIGNPLVILVDFSGLVAEKNEIFAKLWDDFGVDSISGKRDYIEPALFGYATGKVIEHFYHYNLTIHDKVLAHFHEWTSGAGVLYMKRHMPQIATLFTTHATVVGRTLASHQHPLYKALKEYDSDVKARDYNMVSRHSLEKISAQNADCFSTVSEITARECEHFLNKRADIITPNGFDDSFVPKGEAFVAKREIARKKLKAIASAVLGYEIPEETLFVANSGRYEFRNKGIDVFIHAMNHANTHDDLNKHVVAFVLIPASNYGPRQDVLENMNSNGSYKQLANNILTHDLHDSEYDEILKELHILQVDNQKNNKVKIIYAPANLNGNDGVFNLPYYDILVGMDLTMFPSYYEPWGYTPLESITFQVPTVTTNLAGIGMWVSRELVKINEGIDVFDRNVGLDENIISALVSKLVQFSNKSDYDVQRARENANVISQIALWSNLIKHYKKAYSIAFEKVNSRSDKFVLPLHTDELINIKKYKSNRPVWRPWAVKLNLPEKFQKLEKLSNNLWWSWNYEAVELFEAIDKKLWILHEQNPILLLKDVSYERYKELEDDQEFIIKYNSVISKFEHYMKKPYTGPKIAYFSMEYGIQENLQIYSGGLGILAGDYLKEASDIGINMVGVGFLYKHGYFTQQLTLRGEQMATYQEQNFSHLPITPLKNDDNTWKLIQVALPGRNVFARIWRADIGRVPLFLLDTDIRENNKEDRSISHQLYGGNLEHRLKQEMLLGIGGMRALDELGIVQDVYHCNEGHAAFIGLERIRKLMQEKNFTFSEALEIVRASNLFTTHTPVPAGHDAFSEDLIMIYMGHYPERFNISWEEFINLGRMRPDNRDENFSMSHLAVNLSQEVNGVSRLHGAVTRNMFNKMWDGYFEDELHIGYVTNGVHYPTWTAKEWRVLYEKTFDKDFLKNQRNADFWQKIYKVDDAQIWNIRQKLRKQLVTYIKERLNTTWIKRHVDPKRIIAVKNTLNENTLTIGFARRFATYKRANLLFNDLDRLAKILNNPERPIQFIFAGKAHPADGGGQELIKRIIEVSNRKEFIGKIIFLQNYNIELAKKLVQGVDVWLNTPTRPLEASGTSGMKAVMNGVLNFSVLDGWWCEGYRENAGWMLPEEQTYESQEFQNDLDAETIYSVLESEIIPTFYRRDANGVPNDWVRFIKNCIANIAPEFTTKRMIDDYIERYYNKLASRTEKMQEDNYWLAKKISSWKKKMSRGWDSIQVISINFPETSEEQLILGSKYLGEVVLDLNELSTYDIGIELIITETTSNTNPKVVRKLELKLIKKEGSLAYYQVEIVPSRPGLYNYGLRIFPKNAALPHRQDFPFIKWL